MMNSVAQKYIDEIRQFSQRIKPLVVVRCATYNHVAYIRDALESFVAQQTDFPFIVIVHDDASTDGTQEIIKEYVDKYPYIIKPIFEKENQYSKGNGDVSKIFDAACLATGAKYIALCEGDDYWINSLKLQKQVNFLEIHEDYGLVHTNALQVNWRDRFKSKLHIDRDIPVGNVYRNLLNGNFIYTPSVLFRTDLLKIKKREINPRWYFDRVLWLCFSKHTKFHYLNEDMVVYRVVENSATHGNHKEVYGRMVKWSHKILEFLKANDTPTEDINYFLRPRYSLLLKYSYLAGDHNAVNEYWNLIKGLSKHSLQDYLFKILNTVKFPVNWYDRLRRLRKDY
ncbi:MAG: glycosyltransferase [Clostridia bacterium]|nr:glycosyltransferase [Clostridia bacterium]